MVLFYYHCLTPAQATPEQTFERQKFTPILPKGNSHPTKKHSNNRGEKQNQPVLAEPSHPGGDHISSACTEPSRSVSTNHVPNRAPLISVLSNGLGQFFWGCFFIEHHNYPNNHAGFGADQGAVQ
jgi:hypothetical protein